VSISSFLDFCCFCFWNQGVNIALAPEELENLDEVTLKKKYQDQLEV
jgi:hypothetical protein